MEHRIGVQPTAWGAIKVRDFWHFTECLVAMFPDDFDDDDHCTCWDCYPEGGS